MHQCFDFLSSLIRQDNGAIKPIDSREVEKLKKDIIQANRIILNYNLIPGKLSLPFEDASKEVSYIQKTTFFPFIGVSQISQSSNFVINFIYQNPRLFASLILSLINNQYFASFAYIIIPQLFAYFSSQENLVDAGNFYQELFDQFTGDLERLYPLFVPFFRSGCVYIFIESVSSNFLQQFMIDISVPQNKNLNVLIPIHSAFLIDCIRTNLCKLPFQHISILLQIYNRVPIDKFLDFFLDLFVSPLTLIWLKSASQPSDFSLFEKIFCNMRQKTDEISALLRELRVVRTTFEPPKLYDQQNDNSQLVYIRVSDIVLIANLLYSKNMLPSMLSISEFKNIDESIHSVYFWCQIYQHYPKQHSKSTIYPLIFENLKNFDLPYVENATEIQKLIKQFMIQAKANGENIFTYALSQIEKHNLDYNYSLAYLTNMLIHEANLFEKFICEQEKVSQIKKWRQTLDEFKESYINRRLEHIISHEKLNTNAINSFRTIYDRPSHFISMILYAIEKIVPKIYNSFEAKITEMQEIWDKSVKNAISSSSITPFGKFLGEQRPIVRDHVTDTIKLIRCTWKLPFHNRFHLILKAFDILEGINNITGYQNKTPSIVLQQVRGNIIIPTFVILNSLAMSNKVFFKNIPDDSKKLWVEFESSILIYLAASNSISQLVNLQQQILSKFSKKLFSPFE